MSINLSQKEQEDDGMHFRKEDEILGVSNGDSYLI